MYSDNINNTFLGFHINLLITRDQKVFCCYHTWRRAEANSLISRVNYNDASHKRIC